MKEKFIEAHLQVARIYGQLSTAERLKVGCIIVKDDRIISIGYNGMPSGASNVCEKDGETKPEVLHAEANAITKVSASTQSSEGSTLYVTLSPCTDCSKLIHQAKIKRVVYNEQYKDTSGLEFLEKAGVEVCQIEI